MMDEQFYVIDFGTVPSATNERKIRKQYQHTVFSFPVLTWKYLRVNCKSSNKTIVHLIQKKRDGEELSQEEINQFVTEVKNKTIQEVQIGAMLMAIFLKGMTDKETSNLTNAMMKSGRTFKWPDEWRHLVVDKHSTGGVGDKISLVLAPALAACNLKVPMISGRGLEITGGTLDKLESIPGFRVECEPEEFEKIVQNVGCCIVGQTADIVPADKILYGFRDITATVNNLSLTTASILSKKAAEGVSCLILDVKYGRAAFMKTKEEARQLASAMVNLGRAFGIQVSAALSSMDIPIGFMIGNALEVIEAIQCLQGKKVDGLYELVTKLGGELFRLQNGISLEEGSEKIAKAIADGSALKKFQEMLVAQSVDPNIAEKLCNPQEDVWKILKRSKINFDVLSKESGYVHDIDALTLGKISHELGAGRTKAGQSINYAVGLELLIQVGSRVNKGDAWIKIHCDEEPQEKHLNMLDEALHLKQEPFLNTERISEFISS